MPGTGKGVGDPSTRLPGFNTMASSSTENHPLFLQHKKEVPSTGTSNYPFTPMELSGLFFNHAVKGLAGLAEQGFQPLQQRFIPCFLT